MKTLKSDVYTRICTQLTFDLILGLLGHFQTWHPPLSCLKHIKIHFEHGCQNVLKNANRIFFQALDGQLLGLYGSTRAFLCIRCTLCVYILKE